MADKTRIEWADASWNPVRGCTRVSAGCTNCYAELVAARFHHKLNGADVARMTSAGPRWIRGQVGIVEKNLALPLTWKEPRRIFVNSMSDLFHEQLSDAEIAKVFDIMKAASWHQFRVLTKRPERMLEFCCRLPVLPNVWLGTSVEDQKAAHERIPFLLSTPAAIRFLSIEPLIGPVRLTITRRAPIDWVIVGGESGARRRAMDLEWLYAIVQECQFAGVPLFVKQDSALQPGTRGRIPPEVWALKQYPIAVQS